MLCITGIEKTQCLLSRRLKKNALFPMQEMRLDALSRMPKSADFFPVAPHKIIACCRRTKDNGLFRGTEERRVRRLEKACSLGVGWVDVEADLPETSFQKILAAARASRTRILRSLHLGSDAGVNEIQGAFTLLASSPGNAIKLCVPMDDAADLVLFLNAPQDRPAVLVATGPAGILSRALYNRINSAWTYIAANKATAPIPEMPDAKTAAMLGLPLDRKAPFFVLLGGPSIAASPGFDVYNRLFRSRSFEGCYLPAVTAQVEKTFALLKRLGLSGASVTTPHKIRAVALADELDDGGRNTKSINTLYLNEGVWHGANTDLHAITTLAERLGTRPGQKAMILGTGGFARAGAWALADLGVNVVMLGRSLLDEAGPWEDCLPLSALKEIPFHILLNATPIGANGGGTNPVSRSVDLQGKIVIDGVLSAKITPLVKQAARAKAHVVAGVDIWVEQGARQLDLFRCPEATPEELKVLALKSGKVKAVPETEATKGTPRSPGRVRRKKKAAKKKKKAAPGKKTAG